MVMSLPGRCTGASSHTSLSRSRAEPVPKAFCAASSAGRPARGGGHTSCGGAGAGGPTSPISLFSTKPNPAPTFYVKVASFTALLLICHPQLLDFLSAYDPLTQEKVVVRSM